MLRIQKDRCGYDGYTCIGVPSIDTAIEFRGFVSDDEYRTTGVTVYGEKTAEDGSIEYVKLDLIDNYLNIPNDVRRWVMSVDHILDMSADLNVLQPPETTCAAAADVLYDLFSNPYHDIIDARAVPDTEGSAESDVPYVTLHDHLLQCAEVACVITADAPTMKRFSGTGTTGQILHPAAIGTTDPYIADPGCLEPMLATEFSPVDIDVDPWNLNGMLYVLLQMTRWRVIVDERLNELSMILAQLSGLRNLLIAMNKLSICDNFKITLTSGKPLHWAGNTGSEPTYTVAGGTVLINGESRTVSGLTASGAFYAYINVTTSAGEDGISDFKVSMSTSKSGVYSLGVGGVRKVKSESKSANAIKYTLYEIVQERCAASIFIQHTAKKGLVAWNGFGIRQLYDTAECPTDDTTK